MSDHENFDDDEKSAENTEVVDETEDLTIPDPVSYTHLRAHETR